MNRRLARTETVYVQLDSKPKDESVFTSARKYRRKLRAFLFILMTDVKAYNSSSPEFFARTFNKYVDKFGFDKLSLLSSFTSAYKLSSLNKGDLSITSKEMQVILSALLPCTECNQLETQLINVEFLGGSVALTYNHYELVD